MKSHTKQLRIAYTKARYICSMILARYLKSHDKAVADTSLLHYYEFVVNIERDLGNATLTPTARNYLEDMYNLYTATSGAIANIDDREGV